MSPYRAIQLPPVLRVVITLNFEYYPHGMLDQSSIILQYSLDTCESIVKNPENYDTKKIIVRHGVEKAIYTKFIYQGSAIRYNLENVK